MADTRRLTKVMKALANETRLGLFLSIAREHEVGFDAPGCRICDIVGLFKLSAPTISHHLKELSNAELIRTERKGKYLVARINPDAVAEIGAFVAEVQA